MSLINEALKKAQKQRAEEQANREGKVSAPGSGAPAGGAKPPEPPPPPAPPSAAPEPEPEPESVPVPPRSVLQDRRRSSAKASSVKWVGVATGVVIILLGGWMFIGGGEDSGAEPSLASVGANPPSKSETPIESPTATSVKSPETTVPSEASARVLPIESTPSEPDPSAVANNAEVVETAATVEPAVSFVYEERSQPGRIAEVVVDESENLPTNLAPENSAVVAAPTVTKNVSPEPAAESPVAVASPAPEEPTVSEPELAAPLDSAPPRSLVAKIPPASDSSKSVVILTDSDTSLVGTAESVDGALNPDAAVLAFLEMAQVTGVRASATDPKVLMNNRVYRLNDQVSRDLQLRVTLIESRQLQFTDARGFVYSKEF